ncbi:beta-1,4-N-acetylgalactosaminyltransferase bre-4-like [Biomphalaria glabrata]|uniref:Beta-1,4-galactosyltransferase n=1 Tax=Biomphalaria glabrata TaxID=6526 RepID=A0A9W3AS38_BIOGL|nr:beta-1,4-N-acetylgalactosaminyltransferase bre-4-like [Biomphalaria glabrata]KAI8752847.1 beta-1,4-N-acetylgalactosaminyltransferase bre-4 [Biomphalaria glabrata]
MGKGSTFWLLSLFKRKQWLCLFAVFLLISFISSLIYTLQKNSNYTKLKLGSLSQAFYLRVSHHLENCVYELNDTTKGPIKADTRLILKYEEIREDLSHSLKLGGHFSPTSCKSKHKVAVIVPFRDREVHLKIFLIHMHPFLQRQNIEYSIIIVEQEAGVPFNRALLLNVGFVEALKIHDFTCFVFHDVDLLPLDDRILYTCSDEPVHLSATIDSHGNKLMYQNIFGGASMMTKDMVEKVNGFSNLYFGWGGEDDDMSYRVRSHAMMIVRYAPEIAKYTMMRHAKENQEDRTSLFSSSKKRIHHDGLNTLNYQLLELKLLPLYTWLYVRVNMTQMLDNPYLYNSSS